MSSHASAPRTSAPRTSAPRTSAPRTSTDRPHLTSRPSRTGRRRVGRITTLSAAAALGLAVTTMAAPAWAHDSLVSSNPEADQVLEESPEEITLEFSGGGLTTGESIVNLIAVSDESGENWEGETEIEGSTMSTELSEELPEGDYTVAYRVVYSDGHAEEQSFGFEVADSEREAGSAEPESPPEPSATEEIESAPRQDDVAEPDAEQPAAEQPDVEASDPAAEQYFGLPLWGIVIGALVVLGAVGAVVAALRRGRGTRRS